MGQIIDAARKQKVTKLLGEGDLGIEKRWNKITFQSRFGLVWKPRGDNSKQYFATAMQQAPVSLLSF